MVLAVVGFEDHGSGANPIAVTSWSAVQSARSKFWGDVYKKRGFDRDRAIEFLSAYVLKQALCLSLITRAYQTRQR